MQRLRILDITDDPCSFDLNEDQRSLRSHLMTLAKACIHLSKRCRDDEAMQARKRSDFRLAPQSSLNTVYVDVWIDIVNYSTNYPILKEALQASVHGPLRLRCRNLHNCKMPLCKTGELLELLNPAGVRRIELHNIITLDELNIILPNMVKFCSLRSLKLTFCINSIQRLKHNTEDTMKKFTTLIGQLRSLKELNLGYSFLSGCLQQLLG